MSENKRKPWGDAVWVLGIGSQAGLMLALPVLLGLAAGYALDKLLGTLPLFTLILVLVGAIGGPIIVYRMVTRAVQNYINRKQEE